MTSMGTVNQSLDDYRVHMWLESRSSALIQASFVRRIGYWDCKVCCRDDSFPLNAIAIMNLWSCMDPSFGIVRIQLSYQSAFRIRLDSRGNLRECRAFYNWQSSSWCRTICMQPWSLLSSSLELVSANLNFSSSLKPNPPWLWIRLKLLRRRINW